MLKVRDYIANEIAEITEEPLPLMHSCECYKSQLIIESGHLEVKMCQVLTEREVLYFFYGKPSYPVGEKMTANREDITYCPVCFIINPNAVNYYRVFPFDSGAFKADRYKGFLHRDMELEDFELDNSLEMIQKYISLFFKNNNDYILGDTMISETGYIPVVDALIRLLHANGTDAFDDRSRTIEVVADKDVYLKNTLEYIIMPERLLRSNSIKAFLDNNHIGYGTYKVKKLSSPSYYNGNVFALAMDYLEKRGARTDG